MRRAQRSRSKTKLDSSFKGKTGGVVWCPQRTRIARPSKLQVPKLTKYPSLESRGEASNGDEAEEGGVEDKSGGGVLVGAVGAVDVAGVGGRAVSVLVGLVIVGRAGEDTLDTAITTLAAGSSLLQLVARLLDVGSAGNVNGTLDVIKIREFNAMGSVLVLALPESTREILRGKVTTELDSTADLLQLGEEGDTI